MKKNAWVLLLLLINMGGWGQSHPIDNSHFFSDEKLIDMTLATDYRALFAGKNKSEYQPATVTFHMPDSSIITEDIRLHARGIFRKDQCYMPPILLNFKNPNSPTLKSLNKLKLVCGCGTTTDDGQLILKEALVYKIYNLLTDLSLRIRMVRVHYDDTKQRTKSYTQYGFLLEDAGTMAKRNHCAEITKQVFSTESTNREQMTLVALFQYMIGNLDWSVPVYHNIKLVRSTRDTLSPPYVIAYDFDFSGLVNAEYALPPEGFGINSVKERVYWGYPRSMEELQAVLDIFRQKKEAIKSLINNFEPLSTRYKKEMLDYLNEFFKTIDNKPTVNTIFIDNARQN